MKLGVCEAPVAMTVDSSGWQDLVGQCQAVGPDLILLNEMPFGSWISTGVKRDEHVLETCRQQHRDGVEGLNSLGTYAVLGTHPRRDNGRSINEGFVWTPIDVLEPVHTKQFFPNEGGFYEARWFERGERKFGIADIGDLRAGFLICTDVMFNEWARYYGRNGVHLIAVPRATPSGSVNRWKTMCAAAAIVSGCYVASSNRAGLDESGLEFAGRGWIYDPLGELLAETSPDNPVVAAELDLDLVRKAQGEYPCYVEELTRAE